jgi:hypothetical protein
MQSAPAHIPAMDCFAVRLLYKLDWAVFKARSIVFDAAHGPISILLEGVEQRIANPILQCR